MVATPGSSVIAMEYFCRRGDDLWTAGDRHLIDLASMELAALGLARAEELDGGVVIRQQNAYPVYDEHYREHVDCIRQHLDGLVNLSPAGRSGLHRYNNQDHSMLSAMAAVRHLLAGSQTRAWDVNLEPTYHEERLAAATVAAMEQAGG